MNIHDIDPHDIDVHIDRALRREADAGPPADFARSVAALARDRTAEPEVERWLLRALVMVLAIAGIAVAVMQGRQWLPAFESLPMLGGATATNWAIAMLACVALSWTLDRLRLARHQR